MITIEEAYDHLEREIEPGAPGERAYIDALGHVLAEDVVSDRDFPAADRSAMDGFVVRSADAAVSGARLRIGGEQPAGAPAGPPVAAGEARRIYTGAVVPPGADAVVMVERTVEEDGHVVLQTAVKPGDHVRRRGEEMREGDPVLAAGTRLRAAEIAALASVGKTRVRVHPRAAVAVLGTGDEVIEPDRVPEAHQVRNSNGHSLAAQLTTAGYTARYLGIARDRRDVLDEAIARGLGADVLVLTGGVSVGAYDLVAAALESAGMQRWFHGIAIKPGKPILAGRAGSTVVFGLPGNPVSSFVGMQLFVLPALRRLAGRSDWRPVELPVSIEEAFRCRPGRRTYHLATVTPTAGGWHGRRASSTGSGDVLALARANGYVITGADVDQVETGQTLPGMIWPD